MARAISTILRSSKFRSLIGAAGSIWSAPISTKIFFAASFIFFTLRNGPLQKSFSFPMKIFAATVGLTLEEHFTRIVGLYTSHDRGDRGFAGAVFTNQATDLSTVYFQFDIDQRLCRTETLKHMLAVEQYFLTHTDIPPGLISRTYSSLMSSAPTASKICSYACFFTASSIGA